MKKDKLEVAKYPRIYRQYLKKEKELVIGFLKYSGEVLDVGCGTGRLIQPISRLVDQYVGIDTNDEYLRRAKRISGRFKNVKIFKLDAEELSKKFRKSRFDKTVCLWNTVGCVKDDKKVIQEIFNVTKNKFFFTILAKGTLLKRKEYYKKFGIECEIDGRTETIKSVEWGASRAYSREGIEKLIENTYFKIEKIKSINNFAFAVYLKK